MVKDWAQRVIDKKFNGDKEAYMVWVSERGRKGGKASGGAGLAHVKKNDPEKFAKIQAKAQRKLKQLRKEKSNE